MGNYDNLLKNLHEDFKAVLDPDAFLNFRFLFKEKCTFDSMPNLLIELIDLAECLIRKIQEQRMENERNKRNEDQEKGDDECFSIIEANGNVKMKSRAKLVKPFSIFQCTPLHVASKVFHFSRSEIR